MKRKLIISLLIFIIGCCSDDNSQKKEEKSELTNSEDINPPDSWFNIECSLLNFSEDDSCIDLEVNYNRDFYSIKREQKCFTPPSFISEKNRGDIIISYHKEFNKLINVHNVNIHLRKFNNEFRACYYEFDWGIIDVIGDELFCSTIDSTEYNKIINTDFYYKFFRKIKYKKVQISKIILDFDKEYLNKEFFDNIRVLN
jgi:hypothetical protein